MTDAKGRNSEEVGAYEHVGKDRTNLPTDETALALDAETIADKTVSLEVEKSNYPRLAWNRGGDDDALSVRHGPLYVHEKVNPTEFVRSLMNLPDDGRQTDMFAAFNGLPENAAANPYKHKGNWSNRLIRAASQRMMASLLEREGMRGKVDMVYMDPPYNINFKSNMQGLVDDLDVTEELGSLPGDLGQIQAFRAIRLPAKASPAAAAVTRRLNAISGCEYSASCSSAP